MNSTTKLTTVRQQMAAAIPEAAAAFEAAVVAENLTEPTAEPGRNLDY